MTDQAAFTFGLMLLVFRVSATVFAGPPYILPATGKNRLTICNFELPLCMPSESAPATGFLKIIEGPSLVMNRKDKAVSQRNEHS
jgi:hypothetical protein